jgi:biuret amidohydrolase
MNPTTNDLELMYNFIRTKEAVPLEIGPGTAALIVVDEQRYFMEPGHPLGRMLDHMGIAAGYFSRVEGRVLPNTRQLLDAFRARGLPVIFTAFGTAAGDGSDLPPYMQGIDALSMMLFGTRVFPSPAEESWGIDERVAPILGETVLRKATASPFVSSRFAEELRAQGVRWVVVTGVLTECCVGQTARDAAERGFNVIMVDDACTGASDSAHRTLVDAFAAVFGHRRSTASVLDLIAGSPAA